MLKDTDVLEAANRLKTLFSSGDAIDQAEVAKVAEQIRTFREEYAKAEVADSYAVKEFVAFLKGRIEDIQKRRAHSRNWDEWKWAKDWVIEDILSELITWWELPKVRADSIGKSLIDRETFLTKDDYNLDIYGR